VAWIILEGLDRTGKSTVAELYQERGFKVVHMKAPDKKYLQSGYVGPGYIDELMELYVNHSGQDVIFDRSPYGEFVWPEVYGREPQLTQDDMDALIEIEEQNQARRILMYDKNVDLHWRRCVENKEPMDRKQFAKARALFELVSTDYNFEKKELTDFISSDMLLQRNQSIREQMKDKPTEAPKVDKTQSKKVDQPNPISKLETANAINGVLSARIIKKKGGIFDTLENDVREFLTDRLNILLGGEAKSFTEAEVEILKLYCKRIKDKAEGK
jgi:hypothetical protein